MEIKIKKVHTALDIIVSVIVFASGIGLYFLLPGWGILFCLIGVLLFVFWKRADKRVGESTVLKEKAADVDLDCRESIIGFLEGENEVPQIREANAGDHIWMDVFYNKAASVAYVQLYDVAENSFEEATGLIELRGDRADKLISAIL